MCSSPCYSKEMQNEPTTREEWDEEDEEWDQSWEDDEETDERG